MCRGPIVWSRVVECYLFIRSSRRFRIRVVEGTKDRFGIREATSEPVRLGVLMAKQLLFDTFRSFVPGRMLNEIMQRDIVRNRASIETALGLGNETAEDAQP